MTEDNRFFPLFIDMKGRKIVVIGGGKIAQRRVLSLIPFGADITVISPALTEELEQLHIDKKIRVIQRSFGERDLRELKPFLVIAATNDRAVNHSVMTHARENNILSNICDLRTECDAYFPGVAENEKFIAGIISKDGDHKAVKEKAAFLRRMLGHE